MLKLLILLALSFSAHSQINPVSSGSSIEASKMNELISKINELQSQMTEAEPKIATLSLVFPTGNSAGTLTAGTWNIRALNTKDDPKSIITSLSGNQFTLPAGEYYFDGSYEGYAVGHHKARLRNVTDSVDVLIGSSSYAAASNAQVSSRVMGRFVITAPKTFQVQHYSGATGNGNGAGVDNGFGVNNVWALTQIIKIK